MTRLLILWVGVLVLVCLDVCKAETEKTRVLVCPVVHLDPSWRLTCEKYYSTSVRRILENVIELLEADSDRLFQWEGLVYLKMFWDRNGALWQSRLKSLIDSDRFVITHGGWVSPDEAVVDLYGAVINLQSGYNWVWETFRKVPRTYSQLDPFGHSSLSPLLVAKTAMSYMITDRIDWRFKYATRFLGLNEWVWEASELLGEQSQAFTLMLYKMYTWPDSLQLDQIGEIRSNRAAEHAATLDRHIRRAILGYRHNTYMMPWGHDFAWSKRLEVNSIEVLMREVNHNPDKYSFTLEWGTPDRYFEIVQSKQDSWPMLRGDLIPYHERDPIYWSGYYIGRPELKLGTRQVQNLLRFADISTFFVSSSAISGFLTQLDEQRRKLSFLQHHDAITGTSPSAVVEANRDRIAAATRTLSEITSNSFHSKFGPTVSAFEMHDNVVPVIFTNPLLASRTEVVQLELGQKCSLILVDEKSQPVPCQTIQVGDSCVMDARITIPGLGTRVFFLKSDPESHPLFPGPAGASETLNNGEIAVVTNKYGCVETVELISTKQTMKIGCTYQGFPTRLSGAYLFTPSGDAAEITMLPNRILIVEGPLASYVFAERIDIKTTIRLVRNAKTIEVTSKLRAESQYESGIVFKTDLGLAHDLWTDNGWQMRRRVTAQNASELVANSQYPVTKMAAIRSADLKRALVVATRHGTGALNLHPGHLHLMVQRNVGQDDGKGVAEPPRDSSYFSSSMLLAPVFDQFEPTYNHEYWSGAGTSSFRDMRVAHFHDHQINIRFGHSISSISAYTLNHPIGALPFDTTGISSAIFPLLVQRDKTPNRIGLVLANSHHESRGMQRVDLAKLVAPLGILSHVNETGINLFPYMNKRPTPIPDQSLSMWDFSRCKSYPYTCPRNTFNLTNYVRDPGPSASPVSANHPVLEIPSGDIRGGFLSLDQYDGSNIYVFQWNPHQHPEHHEQQEHHEHPTTPGTPHHSKSDREHDHRESEKREPIPKDRDHPSSPINPHPEIRQQEQGPPPSLISSMRLDVTLFILLIIVFAILGVFGLTGTRRTRSNRRRPQFDRRLYNN